jgi:hypothetical protein
MVEEYAIYRKKTQSMTSMCVIRMLFGHKYVVVQLHYRKSANIHCQNPTNLAYKLKLTRRKSMDPFIPDAKRTKSATAKPSSQQHSVATAKRSSNTTTNVSSGNAEEDIGRISTLPDNILGCILTLLSVTDAVRMTEMSNTWCISSPLQTTSFTVSMAPVYGVDGVPPVR